jgi:DNA topoisomerase IA
MRLIELLEAVDERLMTPDTRRMVEELMAMIEVGRMGYEEALDRALAEYEQLFKRLEAALSAGGRSFLSTRGDL